MDNTKQQFIIDNLDDIYEICERFSSKLSRSYLSMDLDDFKQTVCMRLLTRRAYDPTRKNASIKGYIYSVAKSTFLDLFNSKADALSPNRKPAYYADLLVLEEILERTTPSAEDTEPSIFFEEPY